MTKYLPPFASSVAKGVDTYNLHTLNLPRLQGPLVLITTDSSPVTRMQAKFFLASRSTFYSSKILSLKLKGLKLVDQLTGTRVL